MGETADVHGPSDSHGMSEARDAEGEWDGESEGARERGSEGGRKEREFEDNGIAREDHCPTLRYALLFSQFRGDCCSSCSRR